MRKVLTILAFVGAASPAVAATGPFFSLGNTDFVVLLAFLVFVALVVYLKVPGMIGGMLDKRAEGIKTDLDEARALREEAQTMLASYERKQKEVQEQADRIVASAKEEAKRAADAAKAEISESVARRLAAAEDQIVSAEASAIKEIRDSAVVVAVGAAKDIIAKDLDAKKAGSLIDDAIKEVEIRL